ncbi:hypothetical protein J132_00190 [Termitomyces sp. J132]|nr:hypothetical protein H2248_001956 [Termitomyces sp. 'cryptogamus']KNZ82375.1 hypothetical protein J132_00190 [Termitomyces sp. J132]
MVRATTRPQKLPANSQAQNRTSQSRRIRNDASRSEEEDGEDTDADADGDANMDDADHGDMEFKRKANDFVRLALFAERRRLPLRKEEISKKVLGPNPRAFNRIYDLAQDILRKVFGMELAELQTRAGLEADATNQIQERTATGVKKRATAIGSKTYILRSVLHPMIIEHAALTDEQILEEEAADVPSEDDDDDESYSTQYYGSLVSWSSADQLGALGILYTILALILVSGRVISDAELRAHLKHLGLPSTDVVGFTAQSTHPMQTVETYLSTLIRQGYLDRVQVGDAKRGSKSKGPKRARITQADEENGTTYEWRWGSRSQSEVGEKSIARFISEFMIAEAEDDEDNGVRAQQGTGSRLERMTKGIERAAGGQLSDIK